VNERDIEGEAPFSVESLASALVPHTQKSFRRAAKSRLTADRAPVLGDRGRVARELVSARRTFARFPLAVARKITESPGRRRRGFTRRDSLPAAPAAVFFEQPGPSRRAPKSSGEGGASFWASPSRRGGPSGSVRFPAGGSTPPSGLSVLPGSGRRVGAGAERVCDTRSRSANADGSVGCEQCQRGCQRA
jgi:hypothetical protein